MPSAGERPAAPCQAVQSATRTSTMCRSIGTSGRRTSATASTTMSVSCVIASACACQLRAAAKSCAARPAATHLVRQLRVQLGAQRGARHLQHNVALWHPVRHLHRHFQLGGELQRRLLGNVKTLAMRCGRRRGSAARGDVAALRARPGGCAAPLRRCGCGGARLANHARVEAFCQVALRLAHQLAWARHGARQHRGSACPRARASSRAAPRRATAVRTTHQ